MGYFSKTGLRTSLVSLCLGLILLVTGCGSSDETSSAQQEAQQRVTLEVRQAAAQRRHRKARQIRARELRAAARRHARQIAVRERMREQSEAHEEAEAEESAEAEASECDPNYSGACLDPYASDYDCE